MTPTEGSGARTTLTLPLYEQLSVATNAIRGAIGERSPTIGLVLGSGLGSFADELERAATVDYGDIPHFPVSGVEGHAGQLVVGSLGGAEVAALKGRVHFYEGHDLVKVTFAVRTLILLGCKTLIITNAAGGINTEYVPGDLILLSDHLNLFPESPLRGLSDSRLGPRFPDMTRAYPLALRSLAKSVGGSLGLELKEGVYAGLPGPAYETPAEIRMLRAMGADLCGMSTVPEVIAANHMGARVLGISCVTNMAAGITGEALSHDEVTQTATRVRTTFAKLVGGVVAALAREGGSS